MSDTTPTHIHDQGAKTTRCGIKLNTNAALPYVGANYVAAHVAGRGMVVCPDCAQVTS